MGTVEARGQFVCNSHVTPGTASPLVGRNSYRRFIFVEISWKRFGTPTCVFLIYACGELNVTCEMVPVRVDSELQLRLSALARVR